MDGGNVTLKWHFTYLTTNDKDKMVAGTHYANTYYGVVASVLAPFDSQQYPNDGWYVEQTGTAEFDRLAAAKFLGLENPSTSLIDQFNTKNTPAVPGAQGPMNQSWWENYLADGRNAGPAGNPPAGAYNIFACYDYDINSGPSRNYFLKVDPGLSTPDKLVLRIWGCVWGTEYLMLRYLDVQGLQPNFIASPEDWYFNATITTTGANIESRMSAVYHMTTWKDTNWWGPAYMLEAQHVDYNDLGDGWTSRFFDYMAYATNWRPTRAQYEPGTNNFGVETAYITTPTLWNLADREKLVVKLPTGPHMGYIPYTGTVDDAFPKFGGGNLAKIAEMNTHQMWGELVLGPGTLPSGLYTVSNYSAATKMLTINGPTNFAGNMNPHAGYTTLYETGVPKLMFDVAKVSDYVMTLPAGPYQTGVTYTMTVTAKNISGNTDTDWNGTVNMVASAGVTLGAAQHVYSIGEAGVWTTTVLFTTTGSKTITATDSLFSLDVKTTLSVTVPLVGYGYMASSLGLATDDVVSGFNSSSGQYDKTYTVGRSPARFNFSIEESTAYWIYAGVAKTLRLYGSVPTTTMTKTVTVPVSGGWALVGYESLNLTRKASDMKGNYTGGTLTTVAAQNLTSGLYDTYTGYWRTDFVLKPGQGLWIYVTASGVLSYNP